MTGPGETGPGETWPGETGPGETEPLENGPHENGPGVHGAVPRPVEARGGLANVLFDVWLVSRAATAIIDETLRESGLDADEFAVYSVLASGHGLTPTELAQWMSAPTTTVSSYVKRFERRGHVRRAPHPGDRRSYRIQLTSAGRRAHHAAGVRFLPLRDAVTAALGPTEPDTHRLLHTLHTLLAALRPTPPPAAPRPLLRPSNRTTTPADRDTTATTGT